jgi:hypothetical protein
MNVGDASDNDDVSNINLTWSSKNNLSPLRICNDDSFANIDGNKSAHVRLINPSKQIQLVWQFYYFEIEIFIFLIEKFLLD